MPTTVHRSPFTSVVYRGAAEVFAKGSSAVLMILAARGLGREAFGGFAIAWATGWFLATASDLGLHLIALREAVGGEREAARVAGAAIVAKIGLTALALVALVALAPVLVPDSPGAFATVAGALVALSWVDLAQHLLRATGQFGRDAIVQTAARAAFMLGGLAGLYGGGLDGLGLGLLAGAAGGAVVALSVAVRAHGGVAIGRDALRLAPWLLGRSLPLGVGIALSILYFRADLFLLDAFAGAATVGVYASAYRVFESAQLLPAVFLTVLFPRLAATAGGDGGGRLRAKALGGLAVAGLAVAVAGEAVRRPLVILLFGDAFEPASAPLAVLLCALPIVFMNYLLTQDLVARGRQRRYAALAAAALCFNLAANALAIPRYGMAGAAVVTVLTEAVIFVGCTISLWGASLLVPEPLERVACGLAVAALVSLPFESDRLAAHAGGLVVTLPEALVGATVLVAVVAALSSRGASDVARDRALLATAALFVLALVVSAAAAPEHRENALKFTARAAAGAAFGITVCWLVSARPRRVAVLLGGYAAGVAVAALIAAVEGVDASLVDPLLGFFRESPIYAAGLRRAASTYGYPNTAAAAIATALPAVAAFVAVRRGAARGAAAVAALAMAAGLVATFSRGGLVAALAGLVALGLFSRRRPAIGAAAVALVVVGLWGVALVAGAELADRGLAADESSLLSARIEPASDELATAVGARGQQAVRITNTGRLAWRSTPEAPYVLASRWYDESGGPVASEEVHTALPEAVAPGESVVVEGGYVAPGARGTFLLAWDVYIERRLRFSERGVATGNVEVSVDDVARAPAGVARTLPAPTSSLTDVYVSPPRPELWRAAWAMFRERPLLGFGPDSYRLTYGRYLGLEKWDHRVYANNLALELLATSGALGLAAFALLVAVVATRGIWLVRAASALDPLDAATGLAALAALVAFLAHGTIDYFLEFTTGYVAFWTFAGIVCGIRASAVRSP